MGCQSSLLNLFSCALCDAPYTGSTKKALHIRSEHRRGRSFRMGFPLSKCDASASLSHSEFCGTRLTLHNLKITGTLNLLSLRLFESIIYLTYLSKNLILPAMCQLCRYMLFMIECSMLTVMYLYPSDYLL